MLLIALAAVVYSNWNKAWMKRLRGLIGAGSKSSPGDLRLEEAKALARSSKYDQARSAYTEARTLYKQLEGRLGEAHVLHGLGDLERMLRHNDQARTAYTEARTLYKQFEDRLGEANVLRGLGRAGAKARAQ